MTSYPQARKNPFGARAALMSLADRDPQERPRPDAIEHPIGEPYKAPDIGACVELGHCPHGVTEEGATILFCDAGGA